MRLAPALLSCLLAACSGQKSDNVTIAPPPDLGFTIAASNTRTLVLLGVRDGDGAWTDVPVMGDGDYPLKLTNSRYGVAYACDSANSFSIKILQATLDDGVRVEVDCGAPLGSVVAIMGTVGGLGAGQSAEIDSAGRSATVAAPGSTYMLDVAQGTHDAFARRTSGSAAFDWAIRKNDVAFDAGTVLDFDFTSEGSASVPFAVTLGGVNANETASLAVALLGSFGTPLALGAFDPSLGYALPTAMLRDSEVESVAAVAFTSTSLRSETRLLRTGFAFATELPELPAAPVFAVGSSQPYLRPSVTIPRLFADDFLRISFTQAPIPASWQLWLTKAYLGGVGTYTLPDLSPLTGFNPSWALSSGVTTNWERYSQRSGVGVSEVLEPSRPKLDGAIYRGTTLDGQQTF